ncbi:MAG: MBL fold metallo-hydrolase, partial [Alphaproteobacteria bacterium]|nr:MBL fold metallo-hydrolase [Alphaproteobacteria bacterium]
LDPGDHVIFSSRDIPGNEKAIARLQNALMFAKIHVLTDENEPGVHVSGHAARDEIAELYQIIRPQISVPVHGELRHQKAHIDIAESCQTRAHIIPDNGQLIQLTPGQPHVVTEVESGLWGVDGKVLRPMKRGAVQDRRKLSYSGVAIASIVLDRAGRLLDHPQVTFVGITDRDAPEDAKLREEAAEEIVAALEQMPKSARLDDNAIKNMAGQALRKLLNTAFAKRPMLEIHVSRVV